jgi:hypothetical protein
VYTIQVYQEGSEVELPVYHMDRGVPLVLAFDVVESRSRPLSVYFYHADRTWRRDLVPAEYLESFHRDDLINYQPSRATQIQYVHYRYSFPNNAIRFRLSGNYILRVTEQRMEDEALFERPFFVSESGTGIDFGFDSIVISGSPYTAIQPTVQFTPREPTVGNAFDYTVCFVRNGLWNQSRCADRPALAGQPSMRYFLEPETSFLPDASDYFLDVSDVRIGSQIERTDLVRSPWLAQLEPDYFRFPGTPGAPLLNGQIIVDEAVRSVAEPSTAAEYIDVQFSMVPDNEFRVPGSVYVVGSFNGYRADASSLMEWNGPARRYEATQRMKQGRYEYRYVFSDAATARGARGVSPRFDNLITAFVYFRDLRVSTDRLVSAASVFAR